MYFLYNYLSFFQSLIFVFKRERILFLNFQALLLKKNQFIFQFLSFIFKKKVFITQSPSYILGKEEI